MFRQMVAIRGRNSNTFATCCFALHNFALRLDFEVDFAGENMILND